MPEIPHNATRVRILDVAEDLFSKRGYASVTLRDIADQLDMTHAGLYYYAPRGKKGLYIEVMERNFRRHYQGISEAIVEAGDRLEDQIYAVMRWLVVQPPIDILRMAAADMAEIDRHEAEQLMTLAYDSFRLPLASVFERAAQAGLIDVKDYDTAALALVTLAQSIHGVPGLEDPEDRERVGHELASMMLYGWLKR